MIKIKNMMHNARVLGVLFLLCVAAGCSVLPKPETQVVYTLPEARHPVSVPDNAGQPSQSWSLRVMTPYSSRMVDSTRILVRPDNSEISVYKGVRWSDSAPVMVRNRLVNAFRTQAELDAVSNDSVYLTADFELGSDLNRFQVEYLDGVPTVHIQLDAFLVNPSDSGIIASQRFSVRQPVEGTQVPEVVLAFGQAADKIAADIVTWALAHNPGQAKGQ